MTRFAKRTVRSARRYPLLALLCVLGLAGITAVGVAFASSPTPSPKTALFANDASCSKAGITFSGSSNTVNGYSHSNGAFAVPGSKNSFGPSDTGAPCKPSVSGSGNTFNGAAAPTQGQNSLSFPETYNQSTVCPGGMHAGNLTISSGTPSGIYCYSGTITVSVSNVTAKVTFVASSIVLSGSGLNLSPAYGDLLAYDTNSTLGNSGFTVPGSGVIIAHGTVYAPYAAISLAGSRSSWDGLIESDTISVSGGFNFTGEGPLPIGLPFTISGNAPSPLIPGAAAQALNLTINNPNASSISVNSLTVTISSVSGGSNAPNACTPTSGDFQVMQIKPAALPFTAPPGMSTLSADGVSTANQPTVQMLNLPSKNQDGCENANLTLSYSGSATG